LNSKYEKMKERQPFRRDIILIIVLLLLILVAIIFPRFKELREPVQETEIIYIEQEKRMLLDGGDPVPEISPKSLLQAMHERPIPPELIPDSIDFEMPVLDTFEWKSFDKFEQKGPPGPPPPSKGVVWNSGHPLYSKAPELIGGKNAFYNNLVYPRSELGDKFSTNTLVQIYIEIDSCVHKTQIIKSSGSIILDKIAEDALLKTRWIPARQKRPVAVWIAFPVTFKLDR